MMWLYLGLAFAAGLGTAAVVAFIVLCAMVGELLGKEWGRWRK